MKLYRAIRQGVQIATAKSLGDDDGPCDFSGLAQALAERFDLGAPVVLDLSGAPRCDAAGLDALSHCAHLARDRGGNLVLSGASVEILRSLNEAGLSAAMRVFYSLEQAIENARGSAERAAPDFGPGRTPSAERAASAGWNLAPEAEALAPEPPPKLPPEPSSGEGSQQAREPDARPGGASSSGERPRIPGNPFKRPSGASSGERPGIYQGVSRHAWPRAVPQPTPAETFETPRHSASPAPGLEAKAWWAEALSLADRLRAIAEACEAEPGAMDGLDDFLGSLGEALGVQEARGGEPPDPPESAEAREYARMRLHLRELKMSASGVKARLDSLSAEMAALRHDVKMLRRHT